MLQILAQILGFVVENGRCGSMESAVAEVQYEAQIEQGLDISDQDISDFVEYHFVE